MIVSEEDKSEGSVDMEVENKEEESEEPEKIMIIDPSSEVCATCFVFCFFFSFLIIWIFKYFDQIEIVVDTVWIF